MVAEFLRQCAANQAITDTAVGELQRADILVPWRFPEALSGDAPPEGLLRVDQTALNALDRTALARLRDANALSVAYAQIFSVPRLRILAGLREIGDGQDPHGAQKAGAFVDDVGDFSFDLD